MADTTSHTHYNRTSSPLSADMEPVPQTKFEDQDMDMNGSADKVILDPETESRNHATESSSVDPTVIVQVNDEIMALIVQYLLESTPEDGLEGHFKICLLPGFVLGDELLSRICIEIMAVRPHQIVSVSQGPPKERSDEALLLDHEPLHPRSERLETQQTDTRRLGLELERPAPPPPRQNLVVYPPESCANCRARERRGGGYLYTCTGCEWAKYCSEECRRRHFVHPAVCKWMGKKRTGDPGTGGPLGNASGLGEAS